MTFKEQSQQILEYIQKYEKEVSGMPDLVESQVPEYLTMSLEKLKKEPVEELAGGCLKLQRYALHIHRRINREKAWKHWAEGKLDEIVAQELPKLGSNYGWNERTLIAKNQSEACKEINQFIRQLNLNLDVLSGLPNEINKMVDAINNIKMTMIYKNKGR